MPAPATRSRGPRRRGDARDAGRSHRAPPETTRPTWLDPPPAPAARRRRAGAHSRLEDPLVRAELLGDLLGLRERIAAWDVQRCPPELLSWPTSASTATRANAGDAQSGAGVMLEACTAGGGGEGPALHIGSACRRPRGDRARRLERIARRADSLGELLGEEHDIVVLVDWADALPRNGKRKRRVGRRARRELRPARSAGGACSARGRYAKANGSSSVRRRSCAAPSAARSADGDDSQPTRAGRKFHGDLVADVAPEQRDRHRRLCGQTPLRRLGVVRTHDPP